MANNHAAQHAAQAELDELVEKGELTENGYIRMSNLMKDVVHTDNAGARKVEFETTRKTYLDLCIQCPHAFGALSRINPCSTFIFQRVFGPGNMDLLRNDQWVKEALVGYLNFIYFSSKSFATPRERRVFFLRFLEMLNVSMQNQVSGNLAKFGECPLCHFQGDPVDTPLQIQTYAKGLILFAPVLFTNMKCCGCFHFKTNEEMLKKTAYSCADLSLHSDLGFVEAVGVRRSARLSNH